MTIEADYAASHFYELLAAVDKGEEVLIVRGAQFPVRLVASADAFTSRGHRRLGFMTGRFDLPTDAQWHAMDKEIEEDFEKSEILPGDAK